MTTPTPLADRIVSLSLSNLLEHWLRECTACAFNESPCSDHYWMAYELAGQVAALERELAEKRTWIDNAVASCAKNRCETRDRERKELERALASVHHALGESEHSDHASLGEVVAEILRSLEVRSAASDAAQSELAELRAQGQSRAELYNYILSPLACGHPVRADDDMGYGGGSGCWLCQVDKLRAENAELRERCAVLGALSGGILCEDPDAHGPCDFNDLRAELAELRERCAVLAASKLRHESYEAQAAELAELRARVAAMDETAASLALLDKPSA